MLPLLASQLAFGNGGRGKCIESKPAPRDNFPSEKITGWRRDAWNDAQHRTFVSAYLLAYLWKQRRVYIDITDAAYNFSLPSEIEMDGFGKFEVYRLSACDEVVGLVVGFCLKVLLKMEIEFGKVLWKGEFSGSKGKSRGKKY